MCESRTGIARHGNLPDTPAAKCTFEISTVTARDAEIREWGNHVISPPGFLLVTRYVS